jgi:hypothetical protein
VLRPPDSQVCISLSGLLVTCAEGLMSCLWVHVWEGAHNSQDVRPKTFPRKRHKIRWGMTWGKGMDLNNADW